MAIYVICKEGTPWVARKTMQLAIDKILEQYNEPTQSAENDCVWVDLEGKTYHIHELVLQ